MERWKISNVCVSLLIRGADKSLTRLERKQAQKHVKDALDFNNIEIQAVIKFFFLQGMASKEIQTILTETLACFLPGRAKELSAPCIYHLSSGINIYVSLVKEIRIALPCSQI